MDWYPIVKLLHVVAATIWVGGGFTMILVGTLADRANDQETLMALLKATAKLGKLLFMPSSLATLVSGLIMTSVWTGFSELWVIIGLCGYAAAFVTGTFVLKPWTQKIAAMLARDGITPAAVALGDAPCALASSTTSSWPSWWPTWSSSQPFTTPGN